MNTPYAVPQRHWELDEHGQPTQQVTEARRRAAFITPIPKPKKRKDGAVQAALVFDDLSTREQQYDPNPTINAIREQVSPWRTSPKPNSAASR